MCLSDKSTPSTFKPWPKTEQPWSRIHVYFAGLLEDFYCLIVVDSYSKWPEVLRCRRPTAGTTIGFLHELFARFGVVDCVVRDNGSRFTSVEFKEFCEIFQIKHITTPQYHPRSNGQAERFVDTLKRALQKIISYPDGQGTTAISAGIQNHTQSQYATGSRTSRDDIYQKGKIRLR